MKKFFKYDTIKNKRGTYMNDKLKEITDKAIEMKKI